MKLVKKLSVTWALVLVVALTQLSFITAALADEGSQADVVVYVENGGSVRPNMSIFNTWASFCAAGGSLQSITLDTDTTNMDITGFTVQERQNWNTATDLGSFTGNTWSGLVEDGQCFTIFPTGTVTGESGSTASWTLTAASSTLAGGAENTDPNNTNDSATTNMDVTAEAELVAVAGRSGEATVQELSEVNGIYTNFCNNGNSSPIKEITFSLTSENISITNLSVASWTTATDHGSIDGNVWTGLLESGQCVNLLHTDTVTGDLGDTASITVSIISSVLYNDEVNVDPVTSNETSTYTATIVPRVLAEDLGIYVDEGAYSVAADATMGVWNSVCANGYGEITQFTINVDTTNMEVVSYTMAMRDQYNTATDIGSFNGNTWTGQIEDNQCLGFSMEVHITGEVGQDASVTTSIESSSFAGGTPNVDSNANNDSGTKSISIVIAADIAVATRLMPAEEAQSESDVSYEVDFMNIGEGTLHEPVVAIYYLLPAGATFDGLEDLNSSDILSPADPSHACTDNGPIENMGEAYDGYTGDVVSCYLSSSSGEIPAGGSYPFKINMTANQSFTSGSTEVYGVALAAGGGEPDSSAFIYAIMHGQDAFSLPFNNIMHLAYDSDPLVVTVNRCEGQAEETTVDDACFTISFSKPVWASTVTTDAIKLDGVGTVSSLVEDSPTQWTVHITGMAPGTTLRLLLNASSVYDYSAVTNGVSVLGENLVRYAVAGDASSQENGASLSDSSHTTSGSGSASGSSRGNATTAEAEHARELKKASSGVVGFTKQLASNLAKSNLILGSWSLMQSNGLDVILIAVNIAGAIALCFIIRARRRIS